MKTGKFVKSSVTILVVFLIGCVRSQPESEAAFSLNDLQNLQNVLLTNYDTNTRPASRVVVDIGFGMSHLTKLDNIDQSLGLVGFLLLGWSDSRLAWNSSDYGNTTVIYFKTNQIWVPPLLLNNAANALAVISDASDLSSIPLLVMSTGQVYWLAPANFEVNCDLDIQYYPFDVQTCTVIVSSWMYNALQVSLTTRAFSTVNTDLYVVHGEWEFQSSASKDSYRSLLGMPSSTAEFTMTFARKYSYYLLNMLLPIIFLNALSVFVFILPAESGEKVGFSLTILLSLSVMMTLVSDSIPPTSTHTCYLSVYLLLGFGLSALVVLAVVLNLKIHHLADKGCKVPAKLQRFTWKILSRISFSRRNQVASETVSDTENDSDSNKKYKRGTEKGEFKNSGRNSILERASPLAWENNDGKEYSYNEIADMLDKIFFFIFAFLNLILSLVFFIVLAAGSQ